MKKTGQGCFLSLLLFTVFYLSASCSSMCFAQAAHIELKDGTVLDGAVAAYGETELFFSVNGEEDVRRIKMTEIKSLQFAAVPEESVDGRQSVFGL